VIKRKDFSFSFCLLNEEGKVFVFKTSKREFESWMWCQKPQNNGAEESKSEALINKTNPEDLTISSLRSTISRL